jgi:hypothetical protein
MTLVRSSTTWRDIWPRTAEPEGGPTSAQLLSPLGVLDDAWRCQSYDVVLAPAARHKVTTLVPGPRSDRLGSCGMPSR